MGKHRGLPVTAGHGARHPEGTQKSSVCVLRGAGLRHRFKGWCWWVRVGMGMKMRMMRVRMR